MNLKHIIIGGLMYILFHVHFLSAQTGTDSLINIYANKLTGTWLRQNKIIDGRGADKDTTAMVYDTIIFNSDKTYYECKGSNREKKWVGIIDSGYWWIELETLPGEAGITNTHIRLQETYNNLPVPLSRCTYTIVRVDSEAFDFLYHGTRFYYKKMQ